MEQLQSHLWLTASSSCIWLNIFAFPHIVYVLGSPSSYMTLQLLHSEFPYIWGKFDFLFYQFSCHNPKSFYCILINKEQRYSLGMRWECTSYSRRSSHPSRVHNCETEECCKTKIRIRLNWKNRYKTCFRNKNTL